jgi:hypothetical protein
MHASPRRHPLRAVLTSTLLAGALVATGGAAQAGDDDRGHDRHRPSVPTPGEQQVLTDGLVGPLSLAAGNRSTIYVSQNFGGTIEAIRRGERTTVVTSPAEGVELGSVSTKGSRLYYTTSAGAATPDFDAHLLVRKRSGQTRHLADLGAHERAENPDGGVTYGFVEELDPACAAELPPFVPAGPYQGGQDSHPYASTPWREKVLVADAGANAILSVDHHGDVDTLAVLPPAAIEVTAEVAAAVGLPACTAGSTFLAESVPTDVEVGKDGWVYATSLPGGAEGPGAPAVGAVFKIHPKSGAVELVARGFVGATDLALGDRGEIYVTELFVGRVSVLPRGSSTPQTFLELPLPAAVEVDGRTLYVTTDALPGEGAPPDGKVVAVKLRR